MLENVSEKISGTANLKFFTYRALERWILDQLLPSITLQLAATARPRR